jgi:hypothetical protein
MTVTRLHCRHCDSTLEGHFDLGPLAHLTAEQLRFAELFIRCEGKLTRVGEELNMSYPTVRSRLNSVIRALGYEVEEELQEGRRPSERRLSILAELSEGKITAEEAIRLLEKA